MRLDHLLLRSSESYALSRGLTRVKSVGNNQTITINDNNSFAFISLSYSSLSVAYKYGSVRRMTSDGVFSFVSVFVL